MSIARATVGRNTLESNIRGYLLGRILLAAGGFISIPLINRGIGVENYGLLSLWTTFSCWAPQILAGWLQQSTLRYHRTFECSEVRDDYRRATGWAVHVLAGVSAVTTFLLLPALGRMGQADRLLTACLAGSTVWNITLSAIAQAELKPSLVVLSDLGRALVPILLIALQMALTGTASRTGTLSYFLVGMLLADFVLYLALKQRDVEPASAFDSEGPKAAQNVSRRSSHRWTLERIKIISSSCRAMLSERSRQSISILRKMFAFGLPMGIWFGLSTGQMLIGRMILQHYHMRGELGMFTSFQDFFSKTGTVLFMPITYALHGQVMALWAEGEKKEARRTIRRAYLYQSGLALAMLLAILFTQEILVRFLFGGAARSPGGTPFGLVSLLTIGVIMSNLGLVSHKGMEIGERTRQMAVVMGASLGFNGLLSLLLTPRWNALGVAWGLCAGNLFYLCATHFYSQQALRKAIGAHSPHASLEGAGG